MASLSRVWSRTSSAPLAAPWHSSEKPLRTHRPAAPLPRRGLGRGLRPGKAPGSRGAFELPAPWQPGAATLVRRGSAGGSLCPCQRKMLGRRGGSSKPTVPRASSVWPGPPPALGTHLAAARAASGPPPAPGRLPLTGPLAASLRGPGHRARPRGLGGGGDAVALPVSAGGHLPTFLLWACTGEDTCACGFISEQSHREEEISSFPA